MIVNIRNFLGNIYFIHLEVFLGLFAILGYIRNAVGILLFFAVLSFAGSVCGSFIRVIDAIKQYS